MTLKLTAEVLATVLPRTDVDPTNEDVALAEATIDLLGMRCNPRKDDVRTIAAEFARDFRHCVRLLEQDAMRSQR